MSGNYYIYDVRTSRIIKVNETIYDVIEDFGVLSYSEIISKWRSKHSLDSLKSALCEIETHQKKGFFSTKRFRGMVVPYDLQYLTGELESKIGFMILNVTEACNMRCQYCSFSGSYIYERRHSNRFMDDAVLLKAVFYYLAHSKNSKAKSISFYGGEPLLAFEKIMKVLKIIKNTEYRLRVDTNGLLLQKNEIAEALAKNGIGLQISLDGPALYHDRYRVDIDGNPTFSKIIKNLRYLERIAPKYYRENITFAITLAPDTDLFALNEFFEQDEIIKGHTILVSFVKHFDTTFFERFTPEVYENRARQIAELKRDYIKHRINGIEPSTFEKALFEKSLIGFHRRLLDEPYDLIGLNGCCVPGVRKFFVDTNGKFYPCERVMRAFNIGNVDKGIEVDKILSIAKRYVAESNEDCTNCWAAKICGVCFSLAVKNNDFNIERKKENCINVLKGRNDDLITYATIMEKNPKAFDFTKAMVFF